MKNNKNIYSTVRKILCVTLVLILALLCACGGEGKTEKKRVLKNRFTEIPCYALKKGASEDEMRQMAVKAFRDQLTVPWYVKESFDYRKSSVGGEETFRVKSNQTYGGLPYTDGNTGLLQWLQFYDFSTGELVGLSSFDISHKYGNTCATGLAWGISAVCASVNSITCQNFAPRYGYYPVGEYDMGIYVNGGLLTDDICKTNGKEVMFRSYAEVKPGDVLDYCHYDDEKERYSPHVIMAVEKAHVEYNRDGTIDGANSYIVYEDQHMGILHMTEPFYTFENGRFMHYSGHRNSRHSFNSLFKADFIPITAGEFIGKAEYQPAEAYLEKETHTTYSDLLNDAVRSNYNIITVTAEISSGKEKTANEKLITYAGDFTGGRISTVKLQRLLKRTEITEKLKTGRDYNVKLTVLVGTGETFTVFDETVKYE